MLGKLRDQLYLTVKVDDFFLKTHRWIFKNWLKHYVVNPPPLNTSPNTKATTFPSPTLENN